MNQASEFNEKVNILLVDDRHQNLVALKAILAPLNENLVEAHSGREALKCLLEQDFAVILLDVMMPEMNGFETASLIRKRDKSRCVPIIFITAMLTDESHAFQGYAVGAVDYIIKPFPPEILRSKVSVFIDLYKKTEQVRWQQEFIRSMEQREYESRIADAQERINQETQQFESEQKVTKAVMQHAPIGLVRLDSDFAISEVNQTFCNQVNLDPKVSRGKPVFDALPWLPEELKDAIGAGRPFQIGDFKVGTAEDDLQVSEKYLDLASWPIKDLAGRAVNTILAAIDVTQRIQLETQRKDFVGTLAHDLQTPVAASDRALELLLTRLDGRLEPDLQQLVSMLKQNNQHLLHMIQSLLDIYHYEAGAASLYFDEVDLKPLVQICVDHLTPLAEGKGLAIKCNLSAGDFKVRADRTALRRVITNLLDNAIKFSHEGTTIIIGVQRRDEDIALEVENTGIGIKKDDQVHLFERFWHGSGHKAYKGSCGLGLYLVKQIVGAHDGYIEFESEPDKVTKFTVILPTSKSELLKTALPADRVEATSV